MPVKKSQVFSQLSYCGVEEDKILAEDSRPMVNELRAEVQSLKLRISVLEKEKLKLLEANQAFKCTCNSSYNIFLDE